MASFANLKNRVHSLFIELIYSCKHSRTGKITETENRSMIAMEGGMGVSILDTLIWNFMKIVNKIELTLMAEDIRMEYAENEPTLMKMNALNSLKGGKRKKKDTDLNNVG